MFKQFVNKAARYLTGNSKLGTDATSTYYTTVKGKTTDRSGKNAVSDYQVVDKIPGYERVLLNGKSKMLVKNSINRYIVLANSQKLKPELMDACEIVIFGN